MSAIGRRAERVITAKAEVDHAGLTAVFPGAAMVRFGSVVATRVPGLPDQAQYNKARGFTLGDQRLLADLIAFYADVGIRPAIEVAEPDTCEELAKLLTKAGFAPFSSGVTLHASPELVASVEVPGLEVQAVGPTGQERYLAVLLDAYELPTHTPALRRMFVHEHTMPGLRRYLAVIDGVPSAAGALYPRGATSLLAGAATLPSFRRRGCQTALVAQRLTVASAHSDLTIATAQAGSASHDNLARLGFRTTHRRTLWRYGDDFGPAHSQRRPPPNP